jgi:hypothetical protein
MLTMRERILAVVRGEPLDRVPFVVYSGLLPQDEIRALLGPENVGFMRWCPVARAQHPNCRFETENYTDESGQRWRRTTLHTPAGSIYQEHAYLSSLEGVAALRRHYVQTREDYEVLWAYLEDCTMVENVAQYEEIQAELGESGLPLTNVERTPWQQLWIIWAGLENLSFHLADWPDHVAHTVELLSARADQVYEIARCSPAPFIDVPDNLTAPAVGRTRFREYCVPYYERLSEILSDRGGAVFVHMDGALRMLRDDIARADFCGLDSFTPMPDGDMSVAEAVEWWPEKRLWVNFPSSVHLRNRDAIRAEADSILTAAGHTGRLQLQISEDVPPGVWQKSLPVLVEAIAAFGTP